MEQKFYQVCDYCNSSCIINIAYIIIINTINLIKQLFLELFIWLEIKHERVISIHPFGNRNRYTIYFINFHKKEYYINFLINFSCRNGNWVRYSYRTAWAI